MKILFLDTTHPILIEKLSAVGFICDQRQELSEEEVLKTLPDFDGVIIRSRIPVNKNFIDAGYKLKFIARVGAGMDNIDLSYAEQKSIVCLNSPEGNRDAVGEHTIGMLLSMLNNLNQSDSEVKNGLWNREKNRGIEVKGKVVGIIGYGNMGSSFAKKISGFDAEVLAYDKYKFNYSNDYVKESSMEIIFEKTDILSLHIPLTDETKYLVNSEFLLKFKKNIWIINTSRGKIINTADLVQAIKSGKIKGAALDVLEYEKGSFEKLDLNEIPDPLKYLFNSDKVILSPHIAGWTHESLYKHAEILAEKIITTLKK